jgi:hypothetical protein
MISGGLWASIPSWLLVSAQCTAPLGLGLRFTSPRTSRCHTAQRGSSLNRRISAGYLRRPDGWSTPREVRPSAPGVSRGSARIAAVTASTSRPGLAGSASGRASAVRSSRGSDSASAIAASTCNDGSCMPRDLAEVRIRYLRHSGQFAKGQSRKFALGKDIGVNRRLWRDARGIATR